MNRTPAGLAELWRDEPQTAAAWLLRYAKTANISSPLVGELQRTLETAFESPDARAQALRAFVASNAQFISALELGVLQSSREATLGFTTEAQADVSETPGELLWAGKEPLSLPADGAASAPSPRVAKLQFALGAEYLSPAGRGLPRMDGRFDFRTEAAVAAVQADLAQALVISPQTTGTVDARFTAAIFRYAALKHTDKEAVPADVRQRLDALVRRSNASEVPAQRAAAQIETVVPILQARQRILDSMPQGHRLQVDTVGRPDEHGGFSFDLRNGKHVVGEMHIDAQANVSRFDRPVELNRRGELAAQAAESLRIPLAWTGPAMRAVSAAAEGKIAQNVQTVLRDLSRIDYEGAMSLEGLAAPWPSMFSIWGFESSPPQLGSFFLEKDEQGNDTTIVTISRDDFAQDLKSRPTCQQGIALFFEKFPGLAAAKPGDSVKTYFVYTGEGTTTGEYKMLESFLGSYALTVTYRGQDRYSDQPRFDFMVENKSHWQSGTRVPQSWQKMGWPPYLIANYERGGGMFGNLTQRFVWSDVVRR